MATLGEYNGAGSGTTKLLLHLNGSSADSSGNNNNGTDTAITYSQANGKFGQGAGFNGSTSKVVFGSTIIPIGARTISFFVQSSNTGDQSLVTNGRLGTSENYDHTRINPTTGYFKYEIQYNGGTNVSATGTTNIRDGVRHHCVGTYDGSVIKVYVDGVLQNTSSSFTDSGARTQNLQIGIDPINSYNKLNGSIDEVIIENTAWSAEKIKKYYAFTKGIFGII